jgi:glutathione-regulated potassium-efflux system protein KefB
MKFGGAALSALGVSDAEVAETLDAVRTRDAERLQLQIAGGLTAGRNLTVKNEPQPTPLVPPKRGARPLNEETAVVADSPEDERVPPG